MNNQEQKSELSLVLVDYYLTVDTLDYLSVVADKYHIDHYCLLMIQHYNHLAGTYCFPVYRIGSYLLLIRYWKGGNGVVEQGKERTYSRSKED